MKLLIVSEKNLALIKHALGIAEKVYLDIQKTVTEYRYVRGNENPPTEPLTYHIKSSEFGYLNSDLKDMLINYERNDSRTNILVRSLIKKWGDEAKKMEECFAVAPGDGDEKWIGNEVMMGHFKELEARIAELSKLL